MWEKTFQGLKSCFILFISCRSCSAFFGFKTGWKHAPCSRCKSFQWTMAYGGFRRSHVEDCHGRVCNSHVALRARLALLGWWPEKVSSGTLVRACTAGSLVVVSAETDQRAHMIALGDRLRNYCCAALWRLCEPVLWEWVRAVPRWARGLSWGRAAVFQNWTQELIKKKKVSWQNECAGFEVTKQKKQVWQEKDEDFWIDCRTQCQMPDGTGKHQVFFGRTA